jgi:hypothetical protein
MVKITSKKVKSKKHIKNGKKRMTKSKKMLKKQMGGSASLLGRNLTAIVDDYPNLFENLICPKPTSPADRNFECSFTRKLDNAKITIKLDLFPSTVPILKINDVRVAIPKEVMIRDEWNYLNNINFINILQT